MNTKKMLIIILLLFLLSFLVVRFLPDNFPTMIGISSISWEVVAMLRYYIGRCIGIHPYFLYYPLAHPLSSILFFLASLTKLNPFWKQFALVNIFMFMGSFYFTWLSMKEISNTKNGLIITLFLFSQIALFLWVFSPFSYNIGLFFLTSGFYFFLTQRYIGATLLFSFLPLVRHELSIIPFAAAITLLLFSDKKKGIIYSIILFFPFVIYYVFVSTLVFHNPTYLFLFHKYFYFSSYKSIPSILISISNPFPAIIKYNPLIWIGSFYFFSKKIPLNLKVFFILILPLIIVGNISRIIIPIAFLSAVGLSFLIKKRNLLPFILLLTQIPYLFLVQKSPEGTEIVVRYNPQERTYKYLKKISYDKYFLYPLNEYFVLVKDTSCDLIDKTLFSPQNFSPSSDITILLTPRGKIIHPPLKKTILTVAPISIINNREFINMLGKKVKIVKFIPSEKSVIINCKSLTQ